MKLISVIVPVYKVENYLNQCIESIVNQTYKNLEIILVDDGSPDNCPLMCDNWAKKDNRIKVIHKQNNGVSSARNVGLEVATGDYLCFVDSDDTIHPKYCEILLNSILTNNADIAVCSWKKVNDINNPKNKNYNTNNLTSKCFEGGEVFDLLYNKKIPLIMALWIKLYKKDIFKNITFPENKTVAEDDAIIPQVLLNCKRMVYVNLALYNNTQRNDSLTTISFSKKRLHSLEVFKDRIEFIKVHKPEFVDEAVNHYIRILILYYHYAKWAKMEKEILDQIKNEINKVSSNGYENKLTKMFKKHPKILNVILKVRQKFI